MGYNFVIQPFHDFRKWEIEGYRTRDAHFFEHLRNREDVDKLIVINRPLSLAERIIKRKSKKYDVGRLIFSSAHFEITQIDSKVYIFDFYVNDLLSVIIQKRKWWDSILRTEEIQNNIIFGLNQVGIDSYILFLQNPLSVALTLRLNPQMLVFDVIDNWLEHEQMKDIKDVLSKNYQEVDKNADLIISVSGRNKKLFPQNKNFHEITNGVDLDKFNVGNDRKAENIIGYVGKIQDRFDFDLLEELAKRNSNLVFNIYGPIYSGKKISNKLSQKYDNINFMGEVCYEDIPEVIKEFKIAIIPHKVNEFTQSMNPLKAFEYLAAGTPVISTKINGVSNISQYLFVGDDKEEFINKFNDLIQDSTHITIEQVQQSLSNTVSWESKINQLLTLVRKTDENI